ncbi:MAG: helix-turn-helix domain-containing protein [Chloroflexi bacterium]|mgnify:CR=1 FL=1|nr:helix-turn-helix domain-containing protein [Chloroflexota bacterium]
MSPPDEASLLTAREAAQYLNISLSTLHRIEQEGWLVPYRTPGGHRRYSIKMLQEYLEKTRRQPSQRADDSEKTFFIEG